jgi:glucan 1,3-beta-glucosidase
MSSKGYRQMNLAGRDISGLTPEEMGLSISQTLDKQIHGMCFSAYLPDQKPGDIISAEQISQRMEIIKPFTKWIRTFSCTDGNQDIPKIAREHGLKTLVGIWIEGDEEKNRREIENGIRLAVEGYADILAVGNEVMLRGEQSEESMVEYIREVKSRVGDVPVGYVDAYYEFEIRPAITAEVDVILANCYPFWEGVAQEHSLLYMKDMYHRAQRAAGGKPVIIAETGWPNIGSRSGGAIPSRENAMQYFIHTYEWAEQDDVRIFWFSTFDELWKVDSEGDVGAYWGLWDKNGKPKYAGVS